MMTQPANNHPAITQYLLGALPAAESERLDLLSFTDDDFVDSLRVVEKDLIDAYVQGELAGDELERFEALYLAFPPGRTKAEFAQAFQVWSETIAIVQAEYVTGNRRLRF